MKNLLTLLLATLPFAHALTPSEIDANNQLALDKIQFPMNCPLGTIPLMYKTSGKAGEKPLVVIDHNGKKRISNGPAVGYMCQQDFKDSKTGIQVKDNKPVDPLEDFKNLGEQFNKALDEQDDAKMDSLLQQFKTTRKEDWLIEKTYQTITKEPFPFTCPNNSAPYSYRGTVTGYELNANSLKFFNDLETFILNSSGQPKKKTNKQASKPEKKVNYRINEGVEGRGVTIVYMCEVYK